MKTQNEKLNWLLTCSSGTELVSGLETCGLECGAEPGSVSGVSPVGQTNPKVRVITDKRVKGFLCWKYTYRH